MKKTVRIITALAILAALASAITPLHAQAEEPTLRVMSYNIHRGGIICNKQPLSQTAKAIQLAKADMVGIQETRSPKGDTLEDLAKLLGWNHDGGKGSNILTRYEIVESLKNGVKVKLDSGKEAYIFNLHLPSHPYQPYQLLGIRPKWHKHTNDIEFIKTEAEAIEWAKKARGTEVQKLLKVISSLPDKEAPVFVVGDFNEPSHLDWTEAAAKAGPTAPPTIVVQTPEPAVRIQYKDVIDQFSQSACKPLDAAQLEKAKIDYSRGATGSIYQALGPERKPKL